MKLVIREYLASLRERDELDAILPDLLSEIGFNVISRPSRGTRQDGVDIAAVGPDENDDGKKKLFLFSVKSGDLGRQDWNTASPQSLRPSLDEIQDAYIKSRIPAEYKDLEIVICICMGGELKEAVRPQWAGYTDRHSTDRISFAEWNGDRLAGYILQGVLGREILNSDQRSTFQKAVAMVDQPEVAYRNYMLLVKELLLKENQTPKQTKTALRQVYISLWVLYVWAREAGNLDAPFRASEATMLHSWHVAKEYVGKKTKDAKEVVSIVDQFFKLHLLVSEDLVQNKISPYADKLHALSTAVNSSASVDVNLALFECLGKVGALGLWFYYQSEISDDQEVKNEFLAQSNHTLSICIQIINNNPTLGSPLRDDHAIEILIIMLLAQACDSVEAMSGWLEDISYRSVFALKSRTGYVTSFTDYSDLLNHPRDNSDEYFEEATCGSILYPSLALWLMLLGNQGALKNLANCLSVDLPHCTQQLWLPDAETDSKIWIGSRDHGKAVTGLPIEAEGTKLPELLDEICRENREFFDISSEVIGLWPLLISACRHYRMPLPPQLWTMLFKPTQDNCVDKH